MNDFIRTILKQNGWDYRTYLLMREEYGKKIKKAYLKYSFPITAEMEESLSLFYNMKFRYNISFNKYVSNMLLCFDIKKSSKYKQEDLDWQAQKFGVSSVIHIADIKPGYQNIWMDESEGIWGDFENEICYYGSSLFEGIENIINNKCIIKRRVD